MSTSAGRRVLRSGWIALLLALSAPLAARAQAPGRVDGRVTEAETGHPLAGALVTLENETARAVTDVDGRYSLAPVAPGQHVLVVSYLGRQTQRRPLDGAAASIDVALPVQTVALQGVTALGMRARTQARALNQQMNAPNIINVVAADQMGRFPDASAPEAVQRIPGVSIARDQGEGRYIQIRGASPAGTQVTLNGVEVPSPEGEERQIALDAVPVDLLDAIEVTKAILPSMDADAVGGAVNLVTRRAPATGVFSAEVAGGYGTLREEASYGGALTVGNRWMDGRLGAIVTGSLNRRDFGSDDLEPAYDLGDAGLGDDALEELQVRHYSLVRRRAGATANLDYQLAPASSLTLTGVFSQLQDHEQRRNFINAVEDEELQFRHKNRLEELETYSLSLTGDHTLGTLGGLRVEHSLAWTRSLEHTPFDDEITFVQGDVAFDPSLADPNEVRANPSASSMSGEYAFDEISLSRSDTRNTAWIGSLDLSLPTSFGQLRFGGRLRDRAKLQSVDTDEAALADDMDDIILGAQVGSPWGEGLRYPGAYAQMPFATTPGEVRGFASRFGASLETERDLEEETNDYDLDERITAGYVMADVNLAPGIQLIPGVRYEHTGFNSAGFDFDPDEETLSEVRAENAYGNWFPMAHLRWEIGTGTNLRAAYTTAIARPNFFDLVPFRVRDDEDLTIGNPGLKPMLSRNVDLLLEHYDSRIGVASAGVFYKRLADPIFRFTEDNELGGETEQPRNGESGTIRGLELALQRQLRELPFPFDGVGIYANYTFTDSDARLPGGREVRLQGQARHVLNTAISYERPRWWVQASVNYHDRYVTEYAGDASEDLFVDRHLQLDASFQARVTRSGAIFLELVNLTNEPLVVFQGSPDRPIQQEYYRSWGRLGFRVSR